jgi:predicted SprT family Zn-dependent metalloprotease
MTELQPTRETYNALQDAFNWFNRELFNSNLPQVLIVLHRKKGAKGYFWAEMWQGESERLDEIALTPETLNRSDKEILSTLVHEMVHLWQHHEGKPSRNAYHNKEWAEQMEEIGLHPTHNGQWDGKPTGQKVTHLIVEGHRFDTSATAFLADRKVINWYGITQGAKETKKNKVLYTCSCQPVVKVWGKPGLLIACEICEATFSEEAK